MPKYLYDSEVVYKEAMKNLTFCNLRIAKDVKNLIKKIQETVKDGDNILLEPEVIFVGRETDCKS